MDKRLVREVLRLNQFIVNKEKYTHYRHKFSRFEECAIPPHIFLQNTNSRQSPKLSNHFHNIFSKKSHARSLISEILLVLNEGILRSEDTLLKRWCENNIEKHNYNTHSLSMSPEKKQNHKVQHFILLPLALFCLDAWSSSVAKKLEDILVNLFCMITQVDWELSSILKIPKWTSRLLLLKNEAVVNFTKFHRCFTWLTLFWLTYLINFTLSYR